MSGSRHGGQIRRAIPLGVQEQEGDCLRQDEQTGIPASPSFVNPSIGSLPPTYFPRPKPMPRINTARARRIWGVSFNGINCDAIAFF
jgi:hypothetical protein